MKIAWTTDPHLNFVSDAGVNQFLEEVRDVHADTVLVGGDIDEADTFGAYLERLADALGLPVHFVLGNHDYYKGSISGVREVAGELNQRSGLLNWLTEAATHLRRVLPAALDRCEHVLVLMHVPPFREGCWHDGQLSDDNWAPHFTCVAAGEVLLEFMQQHPQKRMTVLCGHTHSSGSVQIRETANAPTLANCLHPILLGLRRPGTSQPDHGLNGTRY